MWAYTTCRLFPPATVAATATVRIKQSPFTVSAKQSRKNLQYDHEESDNENELESLKQNEQIEDLDPDSFASNSEKITGSVVLLALQKANVKKTSTKITKKKRSKNKSEDKRKQGDDTAIEIEDYSDVKPLCIKSDWKNRLDDLEMQLHQLIHHD